MSTYHGIHELGIYGTLVRVRVTADYTYTPIRSATRYEPTDGGVEIESITGVINEQYVDLMLCDELRDEVCRAIYAERVHMNLEEA